jgi:hypothetical protein
MQTIFTKMHIADSNFDLTYSLADPLILPKTTWYEDPEQYEIDLELSQEDVEYLIKAKSALADVDNMLITTTSDFDGNNVCEFIFGDNTGFSNKITYQAQGTILKDDINIPFNSSIFTDILKANKDMDGARLQVSIKGMMKLSFQSEEINSYYYIARNE